MSNPRLITSKQDCMKLNIKPDANARDYVYYDGSCSNVNFHLRIIPTNEGKRILSLKFSILSIVINVNKYLIAKFLNWKGHFGSSLPTF